MCVPKANEGIVEVQTRGVKDAMSALGQKADMCAARDVRFGPIAGIAVLTRSLHRRAAEDVQARQGQAP
jgi:hypothetical protein